MGQITEAFGKAVFARSKRRILGRDAGGASAISYRQFFENDDPKNICPCFIADKNGHRPAKI